MRWILITFALITTRVLAADFRVLDFGKSCAPVRELEVAMGSKPIAWRPESADLIAFQGQAYGRDVSILYFCRNERLFTGNYFFPDESLEVAQKSLRVLYDELTSKYGLPFFDTSSWQRDADPRFVDSDSRYYRATWRAAGVKTSISIMPVAGEGELWHVFVVVGRDGPRD